MPHMPTVLSNGEIAGAPLGRYTGLDLDFDPETDIYSRIGGTFTPFSGEELSRRYPTIEIYVDRVRKAADALLADRYILPEDRDAFVRSAERGW